MYVYETRTIFGRCIRTRSGGKQRSTGCGGTRRAPSLAPRPRRSAFISHKVFINSFCESQFPHKFDNLFFILVIAKDELKNLCGDKLPNLCVTFVNRLHKHFLCDEHQPDWLRGHAARALFGSEAEKVLPRLFETIRTGVPRP